MNGSVGSQVLDRLEEKCENDGCVRIMDARKAVADLDGDIPPDVALESLSRWVRVHDRRADGSRYNRGPILVHFAELRRVIREYKEDGAA